MTPPTLRRVGALVAIAAAALTLTSACSKKEGDKKVASENVSYPVTVQDSTGDVKLDKQPTKIVSISPTATEMLYAVGAGPQVTAVDELSNYPAEAKRTKLSGFKANAEAIAGYNPDLVIISYDSNDVVSQLKKLKIPVYVGQAARTLADSYDQINDLGKLTGHPTKAKDVADNMQKQLADLATKVPNAAKQRSYYHELDDKLNTASSKSFIGEIYGMAGLKNIADDADKSGSGYAQLSEEALFAANPDLIFLADTKCCNQSKETVGKRAGWDRLTAVKNGKVYGLDDDIASRWGPRTVDFFREIVNATAAS